jgi:hypothetical protein
MTMKRILKMRREVEERKEEGQRLFYEIKLPKQGK